MARSWPRCSTHVGNKPHLWINTLGEIAPTVRRMSSELEVEVTIANSGKRRRIWVSALPGIRPGRRLRIDSAAGQQWWRVIEVGQMRLREAATALEMAR